MRRILGIDPGLNKTGWGIIESEGNSLRYVACGVIKTDASALVPERLRVIDETLTDIVARFSPEEAAIEETFVNRNPASALKLGLARGVAMVVPARAGLPVAEYAANKVKKSVVGAGHAAKGQIGAMIRILLPACADNAPGEDEADALAVAVCHAHMSSVPVRAASS